MSPCSVPGCTRAAKAARGLCWMHYARQRRSGRAGEPSSRHSDAHPACSVPGCARQSMSRRAPRLCRGHYDRVRMTGEPGPAEFRPYQPS